MRKRRKFKKKVFVVFGVFLLVICLVGGGLFYKHQEMLKEEAIRIKNEKLLKKINSHYSDVIEISKDTNFYELKDSKYIKLGSVSKGEKFNLEKEDITLETKYFKLKDLGYYVSWEDVKKSDVVSSKSDRYKKYLLFNENLVAKDGSKLYREGKLVYTIDKSFEEEIIIKDDTGYFIEYLGELLFINKEDVLEVKPVNNTDLEEVSGVPVTVYHFIYLNGDNSCNEMICHSENQIKEHFTYLNNNSFFTINTTELRYYLEGKVRLPKKSILITIDDGARAWNFIPILEEYKINATLFLISGWYETARFESDYLELASHTHLLHTPGVCSGGQGSPLKCMNMAELVADLKLSRDTLNGTEAFCFPFYEYNNHGIEALKQAGFKMAFIGGYRKAKRGDDLYKIPRIPLTRNTTISQYANYIN